MSNNLIKSPKLVLWDWQDTLHSGVSFLPHAIELIKLFASRNVKQAVISNARTKKIIPELDKVKMIDKIELVIGVDLGLPIKPYPDMLLYALKHYKIASENTIMFGDSAMDEQAAKKAGVHFHSVWDGLESVWEFYKVQ